ncbi:MAG: hypothetical protein ACQEQX_06475 [Thermodesulfobacteriota bacterium]
MKLKVELTSQGKIILHGMSRLHPRHRRRAKWVLDTYDRLLRMQLDAPKKEMRPSVRKLLAPSGENCDSGWEVCGALSLEVGAGFIDFIGRMRQKIKNICLYGKRGRHRVGLNEIWYYMQFCVLIGNFIIACYGYKPRRIDSGRV